MDKEPIPVITSVETAGASFANLLCRVSGQRLAAAPVILVVAALSIMQIDFYAARSDELYSM